MVNSVLHGRPATHDSCEPTLGFLLPALCYESYEQRNPPNSVAGPAVKLTEPSDLIPHVAGLWLFCNWTS